MLVGGVIPRRDHDLLPDAGVALIDGTGPPLPPSATDERERIPSRFAPA